MIEPFMTQLLQKRKVRIVAPVSYALPNWPVSFGIVRLDYGEKNVNVLEKFLAAWFEAVDWIQANQDEARSVIPKYTGVPADVAKVIVLPNWSKDIKTTERNTEKLMQGMLDGGMIQKKSEISKMIIDDLKRLQK
jgi:NitT/TauT family transport system substrate-binding protein